MHTNVSMRGYKLDIQYSHKDEGARNIYGYWDKKQVSSVLYGLKDGKLIISDISNDAKFTYDRSTDHFGTELFNELLLHLKDLNQTFECINGSLSPFDAINGNWLTSIKFYDDFCKWSDASLGYRLKFHLYNESERINEIQLPVDVNERNTFIKAFTEDHAQTKQAAAFTYELIAM